MGFYNRNAMLLLVAVLRCNVVVVVESFTATPLQRSNTIHTNPMKLSQQHQLLQAATDGENINESSASASVSDHNMMDRRSAMLQSTSFIATAAALTAAAMVVATPSIVYAAAEDTAMTKSPSGATVFVAGATGQTGRRVLERLADQSASTGSVVIGGVRNVNTATKSLSESSTVIRGAMIQKFDAVVSSESSKVNLKHLDVVLDTVDQLADTLRGATALIIATGFVPGNPLKMSQAAHDVDNVGTCRLIDAAKQVGITKIVMVSSILTNGRNWGQEKSPGFIVTNAFGNVLDEKLVAENYLRASGINYTIVRPGGLKAKPPSGALVIAPEDTLNAGEVSRDLVAEVCIASLSDPEASNKVLEIIEDDNTPPKVFNGLNM